MWRLPARDEYGRTGNLGSGHTPDEPQNLPKRAPTDFDKEGCRNATLRSPRDRHPEAPNVILTASERSLPPLGNRLLRARLAPNGPTKELDDKATDQRSDPPGKRQPRIHWQSLIPSKQSVTETDGRTAARGRKAEVLTDEAETASEGCGTDSLNCWLPRLRLGTHFADR
jgi:hypothetical protein